jgi:phosphatidylinositol glycan class V
MTSSATLTTAFPSEPHTTVVLRSAIHSRLLLLVLIFIWRTLVAPYDTSAPLNPTCLTHRQDPNVPILFPSLASAIENGVVWDSVYFVRNAQCGYEYEQSYAFLPLLPLAISFISRTGAGWSFSSFNVYDFILF